MMLSTASSSSLQTYIHHQEEELETILNLKKTTSKMNHITTYNIWIQTDPYNIWIQTELENPSK